MQGFRAAGAVVPGLPGDATLGDLAAAEAPMEMPPRTDGALGQAVAVGAMGTEAGSEGVLRLLPSKRRDEEGSH